MTAPVPGFPPELETAITKALAGHRLTGLAGGFGYSFDAKTHMCRCDRRWISESEYAVHLAAVVVEVVAQHTTTEWGAAIEGYDHPCHAGSVTEAEARYMVKAAEAVPDGRKLHPTARLVLPWQEVKA